MSRHPHRYLSLSVLFDFAQSMHFVSSWKLGEAGNKMTEGRQIFWSGRAKPRRYKLRLYDMSHSTLVNTEKIAQCCANVLKLATYMLPCLL